jgi:hypothetical protein
MNVVVEFGLGKPEFHRGSLAAVPKTCYTVGTIES